jgi:predicted MFS family arabinose efflux permease
MLLAVFLLGAVPGVVTFGRAGVPLLLRVVPLSRLSIHVRNAVDVSGRAVAFTGACTLFGTAAGAALAALLVSQNGYASVVLIIAIARVAIYALASLTHEPAVRVNARHA